MAKISLKEHLGIIEEEIQERQLDKALAHCRHILKSFPKHVDTYRLMAKAYLEEKRYSDAGDIFQRVLSSTPDDFISHVGMSIIREEAGDEVASVWHMERAFEAQPSNRAVQDELRRLYNKREGVPPTKVRLTQGALARMYAHGDLYNQAISELLSALGEAPNRPDLEVLLVEMYFNTQQMTEALNVGSQLLKKLPYCLSANLLTAEILLGTKREEEAQAYIDRAQEIDPYATLASLGAVADDEIILAAFKYDPSLADASDPDTAEVIEFESVDEKEVPPESEDLPGVQPPSPVGDAELKDADSIKPGEVPLSEQEVPEWLRELLPDEELGDESDPEVAQPAAETYDDSDLAPVEETLSDEGKSEADDLGWLESLAAEEGAPEEELLTEPQERDLESPKWLEKDSAENDAEDSMAWLDELDAEGDTDPVEEISQDEASQETVIDDSGMESPEVEQAPDWLKDLAEGAEYSTQPTSDSQTEALEHAPDWLEDLQEDSMEKEDSSQSDQELSTAEDSPETERVNIEEVETGLPEAFDEQDLVTPEEESDWIPETTIEEAESLPTPEVDELISSEEAEEVESLPAQAPVPAKVESPSDGLELARQALNFDKLDDALGHYKKLLHKRDTLDEVIADLQAALSKNPKHVGLWQTLGDAYMRKDRLRDALESYTKAEDLL